MALPLKSGADLYNNQALRLRLHNLGADPTEVGAGLIYFNTSTGLNTSQKARLYTGSAWKTIAFAEDLDVASNADFLALKNKVDAFLDGGVDADNVLENLAEVQKFLDNYSGATSLSQILDTKLDIAGGTISGLLTIDRYNALIQYKKNGTALGYLGIDSELVPIVYSADGLTSKKILHEGNVGEYACKAININSDITDTDKAYEGAKLSAWTNWGKSTNNPNGVAYASGLTISYAGNAFQIAKDAYNLEKLYVRMSNYTSDSIPSWSAWKQIAFTDSTVDKAKALVDASGNNAVTIDADKNAVLNGHIYFGNQNTALKGNATQLWAVVYGSARMVLTENDIEFRSLSKTSMLINSSGNVGIGTTNPTEKLHVVGNLHVTGNIIADGEVSAGGAGEEGGGSSSGGGGAFHSEGIAVGATQTTIAHGLGTDDIVVSIYEKDGVSGRWSIILTDVEIVDANNIIVSFGSATTVEHKVVIMGAVA